MRLGGALVLGVLAVLVSTRVVDARPELAPLTAKAPGCDAKRARCLGIALHVAIDDAGAPVATADWIAKQLAGANQHFEPLDVEFRIVSIDGLPASAARVEDRKERDSFAPKVTGTVIHVFVTGYLADIDIPGAMIWGVAWRARGNTKFIILSTHAWERTLAHELGHVFGLPHSSYPISIMNKTEREEPPHDQRTFDPKELAAMKPRIAWLIRAKVLKDAR